MNDMIFPTVLAIMLFSSLTIIIKELLNYRLKRRLLELYSRDPEIIEKFRAATNPIAESLKYGLLFLFAGVGMVIIHFLPDATINSTIGYAVEMIAVSFAFLVYALMIKMGSSKAKTD